MGQCNFNQQSGVRISSAQYHFLRMKSSYGFFKVVLMELREYCCVLSVIRMCVMHILNWYSVTGGWQRGGGNMCNINVCKCGLFIEITTSRYAVMVYFSRLSRGIEELSLVLLL